MAFRGVHPVTRPMRLDLGHQRPHEGSARDQSAGKGSHSQRLRGRHFAHHPPRRKICPLLQYGHGAPVPGRRHGVGVLHVAPVSLAAAADESAGQSISNRGLRYRPSSAAVSRRPSVPARSFRSANALRGNCDPTRASTAHTGGIVVGLADGSVRMLSADVSGDVWWAAVTPAGGEVQSSDW